MIIANLIKGQSNCANQLIEAERLYERGVLEEIPGLLLPCIRDGFEKNDLLQAYKLVILSYLYQDRRGEADKYMHSFLKKFPEYKTVSTDPDEFVYLYNTYHTAPIFSLGFSGGINFSGVSPRQPFSLGSLNDNGQPLYNPDMGFDLGFRLNKYLSDRLELNLGMKYSQHKWTFNDVLFNFANIDFPQSINLFQMPVSLSYDFPLDGFVPYARAGGGVSLLQQANATPVREYTDNSHTEIAAGNVSIIDQVNPWNYWLFMGGGIKYPIQRGYVAIDIRYKLGLSNIINEGARYDDPYFTYIMYHQFSDFSINPFMITFNWVYSLYMPRKKR